MRTAFAKQTLTLFLTTLAVFLLPGSNVFAACSSPAGNEGDVIYSSTSHAMAYCNSTSWIAMGTSSPVGFGTLTSPDFCTATSGTAIQCTTASTGSGNVVLATSPTLVTPALGTPASGVMTNVTGLPISTGLTGAGTGVLTALGNATNGTGGFITYSGALGTPTSGTLTNATGLPLTTGVTGILPVANGGTNAGSAGITAFNNITGYTASGATGTTSTNLVFSTSPTIATPTFSGNVTTAITGSTQCLHVNSSGVISGTGSDCSGGSGTVTASPQYQLAYFSSSGTTATVSGDSSIKTDASNDLLVTSGSVGIGTSTPQGELTLYGANTVASGAAATLDYLALPAATTTLTGTTTVATAKGFNAVSLYQPTYTDGSSVTVSNAATLYIDNAPAQAGSVTISNPWAIWVGAGNVKFPGTGNVLGTITSGTWNGSVIDVAHGGTNASSASITAFNNITGYTASGATGTTSTNLVFSTSPTLVTPNLGTPSAATLTNATGLPLTTGVTGILPVGNGGTGVSNPTTAAIYVGQGTSAMTASALSDNGTIVSTTESIDLKSNAAVTEIANAGTTGTTVNKLAKLTGAPSTALITATTDTSGAVGIVIGGAGTSSNAQIALSGQASCVFENATVAGDYVQIGSTTAGDCHDAGATYPTSGQVLGRVLSTNSSSTTPRAVKLFDAENGAGGGIPAGTTGQVQYNSGSSSFAANSNFTFLTATNELVVGTGAATPAASTGTVAGFTMNVIPQAFSVTPAAGTGSLTLNTAATGQMAYYSGASAISGTSNLYVSGSNIAIGTSSATNLLSLGGQAAQIFWMERDYTSNTAGNNLTVQAGGATSAATNKNGGNLVLASGISTGTGTSNIQFNTFPGTAGSTSDNTAATAMTITGAGLVGIGTTSPQATLEAYTTGANTAVYGVTSSGSAVSGQTATGYGIYGNATSSGSGVVGSSSSSYGVYGSSTSGYGVYGTSSSSHGIVGGVGGSGVYAGVFQASNSGGYGLLGQNTSNGYYCILGHSSYSIVCSGPTSGVSDQRLKKDIRPLNADEGLAAIMKIQPVHYRWRDERMNKARPDGEIGFTAQNVETVLPQLVSEVDQQVLPQLIGKTDQPKDTASKLPGGKEKTLQYERLIAPVVLAVQQLKSLFDSDHDAIAKLKAYNDNEAKEIKELRFEIEQLKAAHH